MRDGEAFSLGEYRATPFAEGWGEGDWRAGVLLSGGDPRGDRPARSLYPQVFHSREEALQFARRDWQTQAAQLQPR